MTLDTNNKFWIYWSIITVSLATWYILWGPSSGKGRRRNRSSIPGLVNLGNSCFLNAVLQALAACPIFIRWLESLESDERSFGKILLKILKQLNNEDFDEEFHTPAAITAALRERGWMMSNEEQDAHELFHVLTTTLEEEHGVTNNSILSLLDVKPLEEDEQNQIPKVHTKLSIPNIVFKKYESCTRGTLASQLKCAKCEFKYPICYDKFDSLSLTIPTYYNSQLTLDQCLQKFITPELVHDVSCEGCAASLQENSGDALLNNRPIKSSFWKQLTIAKLPDCLCFHLQRTVWLNKGIPYKRFDQISFPEYLTMEDYITSPTSKNPVYPWARLIGGNSEAYPVTKVMNTFGSAPNVFTNAPANPNVSQLEHQISISQPRLNSVLSNIGKYRLRAVIAHLGDVFSGHFITYRSGMIGHSRNKWFYTSDTLVREVSLSEVLEAPAFMLFYERVDNFP